MTSLSFREAKAQGWRPRKPYEYGGEEITINGQTLTKNCEIAKNKREWHNLGYAVVDGEKPHGQRYSKGAGWHCDVYRSDQVKLKRTQLRRCVCLHNNVVDLPAEMIGKPLLDQIKYLQGKELTAKAIADSLGIAKAYVYKLLKDAGVEAVLRPKLQWYESKPSGRPTIQCKNCLVWHNHFFINCPKCNVFNPVSKSRHKHTKPSTTK